MAFSKNLGGESIIETGFAIAVATVIVLVLVELIEIGLLIVSFILEEGKT